MRVAVISSHRAPHQLQHQEAMAQGLRALGHDPMLLHDQRPPTRYVACWGWRLGKVLRQAGHEVLVMERGYLGDRFAWTSLAWNGLNGHGRFGPTPRDNGARFAQVATLQPWKARGDHVLLLGQVPGDASLQGRNLSGWYADTARQASEAYGLPVHFRPHPNALRKGHREVVRGTLPSNGGLQEALASAAVAIAFNSNSAVDAVLAGVPAVTMDRGSMAWDVTGHQVGERKTPDRQAWADALAWKQWRLDEIASGAALHGLLEGCDVGNAGEGPGRPGRSR